MIFWIIATICLLLLVMRNVVAASGQQRMLVATQLKVADLQQDNWELRRQLNDLVTTDWTQGSDDLEEGEDYVRASLGLPSDDEQEIALIKEILLNGEIDEEIADRLAERISTRLNHRCEQ